MGKFKIYNGKGNRFITDGIGLHWERRFEIWEKNWGYWSLMYWSTKKEDVIKYWEKYKNAPVYSEMDEYKKLRTASLNLFND